jgi:hypothetical protein
MADRARAVPAQPRSQPERRLAALAQLACPVGAIGAVTPPTKADLAGFPLPIDGDVSYCGFNSEASFGANSYLVVCWYPWSKQLESIAKLRSYEFSWVLPGHGRRAHQAPAEMRRQLDLILERAA